MAGVAAGLCDAYRTIRIDLVGHGRSESPTDPGSYAMPRCAQQVVAVLDELRLVRPHLLGYSMGGRVALALCCLHPRRVASAMLVGASAGVEDAAARAARAREDESLATRIEREGVAAFVDWWMERPLLASQKRLGSAVWAAARAERLANCARGLALSLRGMGSGAQPPLHHQLADLGVPICLAVGEEDAKFRAIAADLARRLPNARLALVPGAGHAAHLESPAAFLDLARGFLAEVDAGVRRSPTPFGASAQPTRTP
jgi:2-succinyl-6-hydroxy-2,4-cyclohexadiene-1-carboxylate synthase